MDSTQQPYAYAGNNPVQRTDPTGLDWWSEAGDNILAAGAGALSNLTMGASDAILGAMVPGYDCFISNHSDAYGIGDLMVTIVSVALIIVPGVGLAAAGLLLAKTAIKTAIKVGLKQTIKTAAAKIATEVRTVAARMADDTGAIDFAAFARKSPESPPGYSSFSAAKQDMGSPGNGNVFDHVVEQSQAKPTRAGFAVDEINNPFNMNPVSARTNQIKANYYSSKQPFTGGSTVRDWLNSQSFAAQYRFGMDVLAKIAKGVIS